MKTSIVNDNVVSTSNWSNFWHAFASRWFVSDSWAFLLLLLCIDFLFLILYRITFVSVKWPIICWCAINKLLIHSVLQCTVVIICCVMLFLLLQTMVLLCQWFKLVLWMLWWQGSENIEDEAANIQSKVCNEINLLEIHTCCVLVTGV